MFFPSSIPPKILDRQQVGFTLPKAPRLPELTEESLRNFGIIPPHWINTSPAPEKLCFSNGVEITIVPHALTFNQNYYSSSNKLQIELLTTTYLQTFPRVRWVELILKRYLSIDNYPQTALDYISTNLLHQKIIQLSGNSLIDAKVVYSYQLQDGLLTLTVGNHPTSTAHYLAFTGQFFYTYRVRQTFSTWSVVQKQFLDIINRGFLA